MTDKDVTVDANLTSMTAPAITDRILIVDHGTTSLQDITPDNLLKVINGLTADSTPDGTADYVATWDNSASASKKVLLNLLGANKFETGMTNVDPADGTTYYFGCYQSLGLSATAATRRIYVGRACTITMVDIYVHVVGTGSNETSTLYIRKNNTTDTTVSSALVFNASPYHELVTGLSISMAATDYFEFKWISPTWATNPTGLYFFVQVFA